MTQKHSMFKCQNRDILNVISKIQMLGVNKLVKLNHNNIHTKTNKRHLPEKIKTKRKYSSPLAIKKTSKAGKSYKLQLPVKSLKNPAGR